MKIIQLLLSIATLLQLCCALEEVEAARIVYYYASYDLDFTVNGQGKGFISPDSKGSEYADKRCSFDEFVNYIFLKKASKTPEYYQLETGFYFIAADIAAINDALKSLKTSLDIGEAENRVIRGRRSPVGIFDDLAKILDTNHNRAERRNIGITRHLTNIEGALGGLRISQRALLEGGLVEHLKSYKDVVWKIVERESDYRSSPWNSIDWKATVYAYPDLAQANSKLFKNAVKAIRGHGELEGNMAEKAMAYKVANTFNTCFNK
ncbi:hypothetical protein V492_00029 [Pseudogymnoascus sp. VKM F-4246]|nr:hypothetical protein V492_00029 [Pseudogymnoascus sp. VKM F-4246]